MVDMTYAALTLIRNGLCSTCGMAPVQAISCIMCASSHASSRNAMFIMTCSQSMILSGAGLEHPAAIGAMASTGRSESAALRSEGAAVEADALLAVDAGEDGAHTWALECLAEGSPGGADDIATEKSDARRLPGSHPGGAGVAAGAAGPDTVGGRRLCGGPGTELATARGRAASAVHGAGRCACAGGPGSPDAAPARGGAAAEPASAPVKRSRGRPRRVKVSFTV